MECDLLLALLGSGMAPFVGALRGRLLPGLTVQATLLLLITRGEAGPVEVL